MNIVPYKYDCLIINIRGIVVGFPLHSWPFSERLTTVPALSHWPQDFGHGGMLDSAWSTRFPLVESLNLGSKTRWDMRSLNAQLGSDCCLSVHSEVQVASRKRGRGLQLCSHGGCRRSEWTCFWHWVISVTLHEVWVSMLLWFQESLRVCPKFLFLPKSYVAAWNQSILNEETDLNQNTSVSFFRTRSEGSQNSACGLVHGRCFINGWISLSWGLGAFRWSRPWCDSTASVPGVVAL